MSLRVDMLVGNIGTGKSTLAKKLMNLHGSAIVNMDSLQASLSCGEYGRYDIAKKSVYQAVEEVVIEQTLESGISVCIDRTNIDIKRRKRYIDIAKKYTDEIRCYDFGCGDADSFMRRIDSSRGIDQKTWLNTHEFMQKSYQEPTINEGFIEIVKPPEKFEFHAFDFDGTLVKNKFPKIGELLDGTVQKLNDLYQDLSNIIIIWTCRNGYYENDMRGFLIKKKIPFDFINENPIFPLDGKKIFAHKYYDDRNAQS